MSASHKHLGSIIEFLDQGRFRAGLVIREQERHLAIIDADGRERLVARDLVMMHHPDRNPARELAQQAIAALAAERAELERELDLNLLWEVVQEQGRSFTASELAELFFGRRSTAAASVMLEKLLEDRVYFVRRHMDFVPRTPEQVDRLRLQQDRVRSRGDEYRHMQQLLRDVINQAAQPPPAEAQTLIARLSDYLENPFTRSREMTQLLESAAPEVDPAEAAFEILDRLGARPQVPRFAFIAGLRTEFSEAAVAEALATVPGPRALSDGGYAFTIDDEDTLEVDDALACEPLADGALRVRIHIALVSDLVARGGAIDQEAAARATTVYLPETTVWMLPERIACSLASLVAGEERPVLTTDTVLSATGELLSARIYPSRVRILQRLNYDEADRHLSGSDSAELAEPRASLRLLAEAARKLRQRRGRAGALLMHRREAKVRVSGSQIDIHVLDTDSPSRMLVGEFMVLSNYVAARYAAENQIPIIYRVQPDTRMDVVAQRPRLSLYPDFHAGIGLGYYAQVSSPIRRYADLVLQRQLVAALAQPGATAHSVDELLTVLAGAEAAEASGRELERRAKRYWTLRYLEQYSRGELLEAFATREGQTAELADYVLRGTLRGAPNLPEFAPIITRLGRVDPLRGWLSLDYVAERAAEHVRVSH